MGHARPRFRLHREAVSGDAQRMKEFRHEIGRRLRNSRRTRIDGVGHDFIGDIRERLPSVAVRTVFDVGAHIGMTALEFSDEFPDADVWAFEPHPGNFERMKANLIGKPDVRLYQLGLGAERGALPFHFDEDHPSMARIAEDGEMRVEIDTLDRFATANGVGSIDDSFGCAVRHLYRHRRARP